MSEQQYSQNGAQLQTRETEQRSGSDVERSETPTSSAKPGQPKSQLDEIAQLLMENDGNEQEEASPGSEQQSQDDHDEAVHGANESESEGGGDEETAAQERHLETLSDAAKALGTNAAKMYGLQIPMGPGQEPVTLGELKDAYRDRGGWQQEFAQREQTLTAREVEAARVQQDLAYLQEEILAKVPPERLRQMEQRQEAQLHLEGVMLQQKVPEFREQQYFTKWRDDAVQFTGKFGFKPHELVIQDHRLVHMLHYMMGLEKKLERLAQIKPVPSAPPKRKPGGVQAPMQQARRAHNSGPDLDALAKLVKGSL